MTEDNYQPNRISSLHDLNGHQSDQRVEKDDIRGDTRVINQLTQIKTAWDYANEYAEKHGLSNACRLMWNLNEFVFVD